MSDFDEILYLLNKQGWAVSDTAVPGAWHASLLEQAQRLWVAGEFSGGEIGRGANDARQPAVRGDAICWVEPDSALAQHPFFEWMTGLREALNKSYDMGLRRHEFHFARYDDGAGYKKHIDQHRGTNYRKISIVFYLNSDWDEANGGELCLYDPYNIDAEIGRFAPLGGRLAVFVSGYMPHEVLPSRATRWSLTGWMRTDDLIRA
ncbi:2OG-Fe(II) oxygenase [Candidimonas nitroreducens]|uniref:Proline hydroxylase n=1 Tax=Candidimonas nitroreducens TaxID=683354 RepID=A0A225MFQ8_9BURK|nr:2OG-Fe(II) oxygenase [Candidimonas nitroreducens]OWT60147.1 proline hydroxylase [Candidimonas nitroreducens]